MKWAFPSLYIFYSLSQTPNQPFKAPPPPLRFHHHGVGLLVLLFNASSISPGPNPTHLPLLHSILMKFPFLNQIPPHFHHLELNSLAAKEMTKSTVTQNGTNNPQSFKICRLYLATPLNPLHDLKLSVRPLFSLLLLIVFAATLTCRNAVRHSLSLIEFEKKALIPPPVFNATLLRFAADDVGGAQAKKEVEQLLDGNFASLGRSRGFAPWRRFNHHDIRARTSNGYPVMLRSPHFYRYWLEFRRLLSEWSRNRRFEPDVMLDLVRLVKDPIDGRNVSLGAEEQKRYSSCAVVGNSGILLNSNHGALIDSHEVVIRLNNARIASFEAKVGAKTNISFVNSNILHLCARRNGCFCHPYGQNVPLIMYICQPVHFFDYTICNASHKAPLLVTDLRFDVLTARIVKYYSLKRFGEETGKSFDKWGAAHDASMFHYSSGMQAIMLALGICDKVSVFGFGKSESAKHHYHTNQKAELRLHDYEAEYAFYHDLVERPQVIPFFSDKFKIPPVVIYQ